jgi:plasmid stabilization system protein ParE
VVHSVHFHPEAAQEVHGAVEWYRERSAEAAAGFVAELNHAIDQVAELPETWPPYKAKTRRFVFRVYPYSLVYRVVEGEVTIVAVAHAKRKPGYWASRKG